MSLLAMKHYMIHGLPTTTHDTPVNKSKTPTFFVTKNFIKKNKKNATEPHSI